ncbi:MAG TPA: Yip1 family protein [Gaiellaceae bacterium]|nr:Yip1 family protein [Gaiellaceae bacterium]
MNSELRNALDINLVSASGGEPGSASAARDWWLRTLLVLQRPRPVFVALRDDTKEAAGDRAEPILLIVILAGIAGVLTTGTAAHLMDDGSYDGLLIAIWAFIVGSIYGTFGYYVVGALLHWSGRALGSQGSYRRARHVVAFAAVPIGLSLVLWPVKLSLYGTDWFRTGGRDTGSGGAVFDLLTYAFFLWGAMLLVIGVRAVHGWTWSRALAATALAIVAPIVVAVLLGTV